MQSTSEYLLGYLGKRFEEMTRRFDQIELRLNELQTLVEAYAQRADESLKELAVLAQKVERQERQLHQVGKRLGVKLDSK